MKEYKRCSVEDCNKKHHGFGFCVQHYRKYKKYGNPNAKKNFLTEETRKFIEDALKSDTQECIIWPFIIHNTGYGKMQFEKREISVHRYVCLMVHGEPFEDKIQTAHCCGNRACINPKHLRWATVKENSHDRYTHGTVVVGSKHPHAKLSEEIVKEILNSRESLGDLVVKYGVSYSSIYRIKHGISWKHVSKEEIKKEVDDSEKY